MESEDEITQNMLKKINSDKPTEVEEGLNYRFKKVIPK